MLTVNDKLLIELAKRVDEKIAGHTENLVAGHVPSLEAYKSITGEIRGLLTAVELARDALSDIQQR